MSPTGGPEGDDRGARQEGRAAGARSVPAGRAPSMALKLVIVGRRKPGTTLAEHRHHIREVHGERVLRFIATDPAQAPRRYAQHTVFDGEYNASVPGTDPFALNRDFVTQIWFPDMAALGRSRETAFYREHLQGDEDAFVDQATVVFMPCRERFLRDRGETGPSACKLFVLLPRRADGETDPQAFASAWSEAAARLDAIPGGPACVRHVQNDVLAPPGRVPPLAGIDEFWFDDEASARRLLRGWQAALDDTLGRRGLLGAGGTLGLYAREAVLHPGATA